MTTETTKTTSTADVVEKTDAEIWADFDKKDSDTAASIAQDPETNESADFPDSTTVTTTDAPADTADATTKETTAEGDTKATTEAPADDKQSPAPDIWANATPEQRAAVDALRQERDDRIAHAKRVGSTVAGYQRQVDTLKRELDTVKKGGTSTDKETSATDTGEGSGIFEDPEIKKAATEYPEVFGPLKKAFNALEQRASKLEGELGGISSERRDANLIEQEAVVIKEHSDYGTIRKSPEFFGWYQKAPPYIRSGIERNGDVVVDGAEVAHIVRIFKTETGWKAPATPSPAPGTTKPGTSSRRQDQLQSAATPAPRGPAKVHDGLPDDDQGIWDHWDRKDRQKAQNR